MSELATDLGIWFLSPYDTSPSATAFYVSIMHIFLFISTQSVLLSFTSVISSIMFFLTTHFSVYRYPFFDPNVVAQKSYFA